MTAREEEWTWTGTSKSVHHTQTYHNPEIPGPFNACGGRRSHFWPPELRETCGNLRLPVMKHSMHAEVSMRAGPACNSKCVIRVLCVHPRDLCVLVGGGGVPHEGQPPLPLRAGRVRYSSSGPARWPHAGQRALHTCTSWCACAAMFGSSHSAFGGGSGQALYVVWVCCGLALPISSVLCSLLFPWHTRHSTSRIPEGGGGKGRWCITAGACKPDNNTKETD